MASWPPCEKHPSAAPSRAELSQLCPFGKLRSHCLLPCATWEAFPSCKQLPAGTAAALPQVWDGMVSTAPLRTEAGSCSRPAAVWHPGSLWNDNPLARSFRDQKTSETSHREEEGRNWAFRASHLQRTQLSSLAACLVQGGFPWQFCDVHTFKSPASYFYGGFRQVESTLKMQRFSNFYFFEEFWWNGNIFSPFPISYLCWGTKRIPLHSSMTVTGDSHQWASAESKSPMLTYSNFWPQATSRDLIYCTENFFKRFFFSSGWELSSIPWMHSSCTKHLVH